MNAKISMVKLSQLLANEVGKTQKQCEDFLRALFQQITNGLEQGESVKIKGFGTFKLTNIESRKSVDVTTGEENEIPAHRRIVFVPSKELAASVNAPFEMFETVVLDENVLEEELMQAEATGNEALVEEIQEEIMLDEQKLDSMAASESGEPVVKAEPEKKSMPEENPESDKNSEPEIKPTAEVRQVTSEQMVKPVQEVSHDINVKSESENITKGEDKAKKGASAEDSVSDSAEEIKEERKNSRRWWMYIAAALIVLIGGCVTLWFVNDDFSGMISGIFHTDRQTAQVDTVPAATEQATLSAQDEASDLNENMSGVDGIVEDNTEEGVNEEKETKEDVAPTKPSDEPVYDHVSQTRYLSTIAKEHYGNYNLWPYIYKENEKILGHPNRIKPGTKVVVPDLAKYGVDPKNKADIAKAKKLGVEIYSRYK